MKLSQYKEKKNSKKIIIIIGAILLFIGGIIVDRTFANFKTQKSFKVMEGNFIYEGSGDIIFAFYNGNESLTKMPVKNNEEKLAYVKGECDKGASIEWDDDAWSPKILNLQETKTTCKLYFNRVYESICSSSGEDSGACYLAKKGENDKTNMRYDFTKDNNVRFIGATPNNYIKFNNETWRIIGVMDNIEDESGNIGSHIKIIRDSIGNFSWDSIENGINDGEGVNEWSTSAIETVLNEKYYNKETGGTCYNGKNKKEIACPLWENIGLDDKARTMISKVKWNLGTIPKIFSYDTSIITPMYMYEMERSENNGKICTSNATKCNDEVKRTTIWLGYVGLMYPSDYGYATSGGNIVKRQMCLSSSMYNWSNSDFKSDCASKSWLYSSNNNQWTITASTHQNPSYVFELGSNYAVNSRNTSYPNSVRPVVYLNSNIKFEEDTSSNYGSSTNPYRLVTS